MYQAQRDENGQLNDNSYGSSLNTWTLNTHQHKSNANQTATMAIEQTPRLPQQSQGYMGILPAGWSQAIATSPQNALQPTLQPRQALQPTLQYHQALQPGLQQQYALQHVPQSHQPLQPTLQSHQPLQHVSQQQHALQPTQQLMQGQTWGNTTTTINYGIHFPLLISHLPSTNVPSEVQFQQGQHIQNYTGHQSQSYQSPFISTMPVQQQQQQQQQQQLQAYQVNLNGLNQGAQGQAVQIIETGYNPLTAYYALQNHTLVPSGNSQSNYLATPHAPLHNQTEYLTVPRQRHLHLTHEKLLEGLQILESRGIRLPRLPEGVKQLPQQTIISFMFETWYVSRDGGIFTPLTLHIREWEESIGPATKRNPSGFVEAEEIESDVVPPPTAEVTYVELQELLRPDRSFNWADDVEEEIERREEGRST